jgi:Ca2+/H+ antiporter
MQEAMLFIAFQVVASIEEFAERYQIPKPFIGLILLPIVVSNSLLLFHVIE